MSDDSSSAARSNYPPLERPVLLSDIPPVLLEKATPAERYILEQLSVQKQFIDWSIDAHLSTNHAVRVTNGRLLKAEGTITQLQSVNHDAEVRSKSWWRVLGRIGVVVGVSVSIIEALHYLAQIVGGHGQGK